MEIKRIQTGRRGDYHMNIIRHHMYTIIHRGEIDIASVLYEYDGNIIYYRDTRGIKTPLCEVKGV